MKVRILNFNISEMLKTGLLGMAFAMSVHPLAIFKKN